MTSEYDGPTALGQVPTTGRGSLPFALLAGQPLVLLASYALEDAGVELVDFDLPVADVSPGLPVVIHDPLCPLTPVDFLREAVVRAVEEDRVVVGVQPVTDTIKSVSSGVVGETVDRDALWTVTSPVVLPASVVPTLTAWPDDVVALVAELRARHDVIFLEAPSIGRRVDDDSSVRLLEALAANEAADLSAVSDGLRPDQP